MDPRQVTLGKTRNFISDIKLSLCQLVFVSNMLMKKVIRQTEIFLTDTFIKTGNELIFGCAQSPKYSICIK